MDAVDVAFVSFEKPTPVLVATLKYPFPIELKKQCLAITETGRCSIDEYGALDVKVGEMFSDAILTLLQQVQVSPKDVRAIGSHGQNLRHSPGSHPPFTLQIGDPNVIAERTGIQTIADFRRRDLAAGGQGAPLAPALHAYLFKHPKEDRVIVNIGGISNITILPNGRNLNPILEEDSVRQDGVRQDGVRHDGIRQTRGTAQIIGFDTGPGNCLMDAWIKKNLDKDFDMDGRYAVSGKVEKTLLLQCLSDPYFSAPLPKSTGREYFNLEWLTKQLQIAHIGNVPAQNVQATLLVLTARSISNAILNYAPPNAQVFVCGGGAHNGVLMDMLEYELQRQVRSTAILDISPDWVEAILFAWLAKQTLEGRPGNCPSVTGARGSLTLGGIFGFNRLQRI